MKHLFSFLFLSLFLQPSFAKPISFEYEKLPANSGFKMDGYWVWGGSMIEVVSVLTNIIRT